MARWWHRGLCPCPAAVGGEGVGGVGGGVGDESAAAAGGSVSSEFGGRQLAREASAILIIVRKIVLWGALFFAPGSAFFAPGSALYCPPLTVVRPVSKIFQV